MLIEPPEGATIKPEFNAMEMATLRHLIEIGTREGDPLLVHGINAVGEKLAVATIRAMPPAVREQLPEKIAELHERVMGDENIPEEAREQVTEQIADLVAAAEAEADKDQAIDESEVEAFNADDLLDQINAAENKDDET